MEIRQHANTKGMAGVCLALVMVTMGSGIAVDRRVVLADEESGIEYEDSGLAGGLSSPAEAASIEIAQNAASKATKLKVHELVDQFDYKIFFYNSLNDEGNYAKLSENDRRNLRSRVGNGPFFLHRFSDKGGNNEVLDVFVSGDGKRVLHQRVVRRTYQQNARVPKRNY